MQFAGLLVNYFTHPSEEELLLCSQIERFEIGGSFSPEAGKWLAYAKLTEDSDKEPLCDVYVFEAESRKLVMVSLGFSFSFFKSSRASLAMILKDANTSMDASPIEKKGAKASFEPVPRKEPLIESLKAKPKESSSVRADLIDLLSKVTDIPIEEINDEATLGDLGIDSLMANDVLNELQKAFGVPIDMTEFLFFGNVCAVTAHLDERLGNSSGVISAAKAKTGAPASENTTATDSQGETSELIGWAFYPCSSGSVRGDTA